MGTLKNITILAILSIFIGLSACKKPPVVEPPNNSDLILWEWWHQFTLQTEGGNTEYVAEYLKIDSPRYMFASNGNIAWSWRQDSHVWPYSVTDDSLTMNGFTYGISISNDTLIYSHYGGTNNDVVVEYMLLRP